ncbi:hypothetical protein [Algoriphagus litoralis]|uniref:hypothetical protein n=1 Tax=Algoriphagus litoralis TaxID=2202829 RepID=UPI000DBA5280|nr:hypothetical protein [Algoriphagus litoralis]
MSRILRSNEEWSTFCDWTPVRLVKGSNSGWTDPHVQVANMPDFLKSMLFGISYPCFTVFLFLKGFSGMTKKYVLDVWLSCEINLLDLEV